jgi:hypothetical protein
VAAALLDGGADAALEGGVLAAEALDLGAELGQLGVLARFAGDGRLGAGLLGAEVAPKRGRSYGHRPRNPRPRGPFRGPGGEDDGDWHVRRWRLRGTLRGEFPLHRFPFDAQKLSIDVELPERDAVLAPDLTGSGMETHFSVTGWNYDPHFHPRASRSVYASDLGSLAHEGQRTTVHHVRFEVTLRRPAITVALKLFMPLALLLLVALVALSMPVDLVDTRGMEPLGREEATGAGAGGLGALAQGLKSAVYLFETPPHDPVRQRDPAHQPRR